MNHYAGIFTLSILRKQIPHVWNKQFSQIAEPHLATPFFYLLCTSKVVHFYDIISISDSITECA